MINSCEVINPEEDTPSYIHIEKISLTTDSLTEGTSSHKIVDAWVYIDDNFLGAYELPVTFPVLAEGSHEINIRPGIKVNGISATRSKYPFFDLFSVNVSLISGKITSINPVVGYNSTTVFEWIEDFESAGFTIDTIGTSDTSMQFASVDTLDILGGKSAAIYLDDAHTNFECVTLSGQFDLPIGNSVFLEMNYKCNNEFFVGLYKNSVSPLNRLMPSLYINPSETWNKIYIDLTNDVKQQINASSFEIYIGIVKSVSVAQPEVFLDNIKLIHY